MQMKELSIPVLKRQLTLMIQRNDRKLASNEIAYEQWLSSYQLLSKKRESL